MASIWTLSLYILISAASVAAISFREQPESTIVSAGETVKLHCSVNNQADINLYWQNLDTTSYVSLDRRLNPYGQINGDQRQRYSIVGNPERGEYHLQINNASKVDEGRYACVFFLNFNYYSQVAKLRVVRPPDRGYPKCTVDPIKRSNIGDNVTLICESRGGDPPATLSWVRGTTRLVTQRGRLAKGDPVVHYSLTLTENESDVRFTCVANNLALQQPRTCSLTPLRSSLGVLLRPVVASVEVGESFTFVCITERMPNLAYQWYINNEPIDGRETRFSYIQGGQRLLIDAVTMEDDYALVKCEVTQKDHGYSGSAVGLLWVQSRNVGTPDITETVATHLPKQISTKSQLTKKIIKTTLMATTATTPMTTTVRTTELLTTISHPTTSTATTPPPSSTTATTTPPPTTTSSTATSPLTTTAPTTHLLTTEVTTPQPTTEKTVTFVKAVLTTTPPSISKAICVTLAKLLATTRTHKLETSDISKLSSEWVPTSSASSDPEFSSSFSSVSHLSSEDHATLDDVTPSQAGNESLTNSRSLGVTQTTNPSFNEVSSDFFGTSIYAEETNTIPAEREATNPIPGSSIDIGKSENSNIINRTFETPSTQGTVGNNDTVFGKNNIQTVSMETGSGDWSESVSIGSTDNGPWLPNETGIGYNSAGSMLNWGLIAGLLVVFIIIVVAVGALAAYLYRRREKATKAKPTT